MLGCIENVNIISSFKTKNHLFAKIENRKSYGFMFKIKGYNNYNFGNKKLTLNAGSVIFIPQGSSYEYTSYEPENLYTTINFYANIENPTPTVYSLDDFYGTNFIYESFTNLWRFGTLPDKYKCISVFYEFLSYLARLEHLSILNKNKYFLIEPAIEYLKTHLFDCNLKIDNLHKFCSISDTYFRKVFVSRFNVSPQEYVINKRISHAKAILESGDFTSVNEVAELVGYNDPLYFSKAFKKICGLSPTLFIKSNM